MGFHTRLHTLWLMSLQGQGSKQADLSLSLSRLQESLLTRFAIVHPAVVSVPYAKMTRSRPISRRRQLLLQPAYQINSLDKIPFFFFSSLSPAFAARLLFRMARGHTSSKPRQPLSAYSFGAPLWLLNRIPFYTP